MISFNRRFDPNFASLKTAFDGGEIGRGGLPSVTSLDPALPPVSHVRVSCGFFRDMIIYDFDMWAFLFGLPERVMTHGSCLADPAISAAGDVDTAVAVLSYTDGRLAKIRNSPRAAFGYDQRAELLGSDGMLSAGNELESTVVKATAAGVDSAKPVLFFLKRYMRAFAIEWSAFLDACTEGAPVPDTLEYGVNALAMAEAATRSLAAERPVEAAGLLAGD